MEAKDFEKLMYHFTQASTPEELQGVCDEIGDLTDEQRVIFTNLYETRLKEVLKRSDELMTVARLRMKLEPVTDYLSMAYVADRFFGKSRSWLANKLSGKATPLNDEERRTLSSALNTLSKELGEAAARISS